MTVFKTATLSVSILLGLTLSACSDADKTDASTKITDAPKVTIEAQVEVPLPTDAEGLQNEMIRSFDSGNFDRFNATKTAYVETLTDRRQQRDFVNQLWEGKNGYEKRRDIAFPLAVDLSDRYDISAPTYLAGFGYWTGEGTEKNLEKALEYWAKPSVAQNSTVTYRRAIILLDSEQTYYDAVQARELMENAANAGNADAATWLRNN